jgi:hypothetical protein
MDVKVYLNAADFLVKTADLLRSDEARYGLIYGIARAVNADPHHYGEEDPSFWVVNDANGISTMAWRTPPYPVGLAWHAGDPGGSHLPIGRGHPQSLGGSTRGHRTQRSNGPFC